MSNSPQLFLKLAQWLSLSLSLSPSQFLLSKLFRITNFLLQSLFFSKAILASIATLSLFFGITWISPVTDTKPVYILIGLLFMWLHFWSFSDNYQLLHECIKLMSGFYVGLYAVEGCAYAKDYIQGEKLQLVRGRKQKQEGVMKNIRGRDITKQIALIGFTLFSTFFFVFIWYQSNIQKSLPYLVNNEKILTNLITATIILFLVAIIKKVSLFLPALVSFLILYGTVSLRLLLFMFIYPNFPEFQHLSLPLQALFVMILAVEGKQRHIRQALSELESEQRKVGEEHRDEMRKIKKMQIDKTFWVGACYYLYTVTHGYEVNMQYLIIPVFCWLVLKNHVK